MKHHTSHITHHTSHITHHASHVTHHFSHVDRISIQGHLQSRNILRKQQGKKNVATVAYTQPGKKGKKRKNDGEPKVASEFMSQGGAVSATAIIPDPKHESTSSSGSMFHGGPTSAISKIPASKPRKQQHRGNGDHIPEKEKLFCDVCSAWIVHYKMPQHNLRKGHNRRLKEQAMRAEQARRVEQSS